MVTVAKKMEVNDGGDDERNGDDYDGHRMGILMNDHCVMVGNKSNRVRQSDAICGVMVLLMIALLFILLVIITLKICLNSITSV